MTAARRARVGTIGHIVERPGIGLREPLLERTGDARPMVGFDDVSSRETG
jgi:hypothetical protein